MPFICTETFVGCCSEISTRMLAVPITSSQHLFMNFLAVCSTHGSGSVEDTPLEGDLLNFGCDKVLPFIRHSTLMHLPLKGLSARL